MGKLKSFITLLVFVLISVSPAVLFGQDIDNSDRHFIDSVKGFTFQYITSSPNKAVEDLQKARILADSLNLKEDLAEILSKISWSKSYLGEWDESIDYRMQSIRLYEEHGMMLEAGYGFAELGYGVRRRDVERAEYFMMQGIRILEEFPNSPELANAYNNYGIVKLAQQQVDSTIIYVNKSLEIKRLNKDTLGIAYSYGYLGTAYQEMQDYDTAIRYLQDSYDLKEQLYDSAGMAIDLTNIAAIYGDQGSMGSAIQNFRASLNMALAIDYHHLAEHNFNSLAQLFEQEAMYDSALHYQKRFTEFREERVNESTNARLAELEVQFETEQKEKELALQKAALASTQLKIRNRNWILTALAGFLIFGGVIVTMVIRQQRIKQRENELKLKLAKSETENRIHQERERISRDLHDNVGAQITSLISGLEISNLYVKNNKKEDALGLIQTLDSNARDAMSELRETIWLLNKDKIIIGDFIRHLRSYIEKHRSTFTELEIEIYNEVDESQELTAQQSLNLLRIIQEALNNCVKYAEASNFSIHLLGHQGRIQVMIRDNGKGLSNDQTSNGTEAVLSGFGVGNMKKRAEELDGHLKMKTEDPQGIAIEISFPLAPSDID